MEFKQSLSKQEVDSYYNPEGVVGQDFSINVLNVSWDMELETRDYGVKGIYINIRSIYIGYEIYNDESDTYEDGEMELDLDGFVINVIFTGLEYGTISIEGIDINFKYKSIDVTV